MKLKLLGTGSVSSKSNSACALINNNILVDVSNGICKRLNNMNYDLQNIEVCLITHFHGDHYFDLPFLLLEKTFNLKGKETFTIIGSRGIEEKVKMITELAFPNNWDTIKSTLELKFIENTNLSKNLILDNIEVTCVKVKHGDCDNAWGYILKDTNHSIGFTGDTSLCEEVEYINKNSEVLVADMSLEKGNDEHMGMDNILYLADKYKNVTIISTHMRDSTKQMAKKLGIPNVIIPNDGYVFEL